MEEDLMFDLIKILKNENHLALSLNIFLCLGQNISDSSYNFGSKSWYFIGWITFENPHSSGFLFIL